MGFMTECGKNRIISGFFIEGKGRIILIIKLLP
jgi:hypothetical protein